MGSGLRAIKIISIIAQMYMSKKFHLFTPLRYPNSFLREQKNELQIIANILGRAYGNV